MGEIILVIAKSNISGLGLFSDTDIPIGKRLFTAFTITEGLWSKEREPTNYVNHSDNPSMSILKIGNDLVFHACRHIPKGEEMTVDYATVVKHHPPFNPLSFEQDKEYFQKMYDVARPMLSEMYNRKIGTVYQIN